jgi:hypothetical protein
MDDSEKEAIEFFSPYFDKFLECQHAVNKRFANLIAPESRARIQSRSYSSCLNDLMIAALHEAFIDIQDIRPLKRYAQTTFLFSGQYRMKAKKFDDKFRLSFIPTQAALDFLDYNIQLSFNNMAEPLSIMLCYRLNPIHTEIQDVYLARPDGKNNFRWLHKIEPAVGVKSTQEQ